MQYAVAFYGPNGRYAVELYPRYVGSEFVALARELYQQDISLSSISCYLSSRFEKNLTGTEAAPMYITEEQALESGRFTQTCFLRVVTPNGPRSGGGGWLNDCVITYPAKDANGNIYPIWKVDYEAIWLKWKAYGFFNTLPRGFSVNG